jgi:archaetidylinositol phosphate synthase
MTPVTRIQQNMLATSERRLLNWICPRLPAWMTPDQLTIIGFSGTCITAAGYILSNWSAIWLWVAIAGYFINWFGDSLDGSLARFRKIERPDYGYFIDHSTDSLANVILVSGIGLSPYVDLNVALFGLAGYLLLSIHTFLAAKVMGEFRLSYASAGPTELRIGLVIMTLIMLVVGPEATAWRDFTGFDIGLGIVGAILVLLYIKQTFSSAQILLRQEHHAQSQSRLPVVPLAPVSTPTDLARTQSQS